jgi:uncharacterized membrane protein YhiD involved in acid resistance
MRYCLFCLLFIVCACNEKQPKQKIVLAQNDSAIKGIQTGDLILRRGRDQVSDFFARLNTRNQTYSHCGLAVQTDSGVYVYHIMATLNHIEGQILCEPIDSFIDSKINSRWAIIRYNLDSIKQSHLLAKVQDYITQKITFDQQFNLQSDDKMYCSEMLYKAFLFASKDAQIIPITIAHSGKKYIAIDNLFEHKHCKTIGEIAYKQ